LSSVVAISVSSDNSNGGSTDKPWNERRRTSERISEGDVYRLDVAQRPNDPTLASYEQVPVDKFGYGMLMGMGWKPGQGVGKNKALVKPIQTAPRPSRQGLGATMSKFDALKAAAASVTLLSSISDRIIPVHMRQLKVNALVEVIKGHYRSSYGRATKIIFSDYEEEHKIVVVQLNMTRKVIECSEHDLQVLDEAALPLDHPARYTADNPPPKPVFLHRNSPSSSHSRSHSRSRSRSRSHSRSRSQSPLSGRSSQKPRSDKKLKKHHKHDKLRNERKHRHKHKHNKSAKNNKRKSGWARSCIRVRIIDRSIEGGNLYCKCGRVEDVISTVQIAVVMEDTGHIVDGIREDQLETALPKSAGTGSQIMIVDTSSEHVGQIATLLEKDTQKQIATIQLEQSLEYLTIHFDDIAQYLP